MLRVVGGREPVGSANKVVTEVGGNLEHIAPMGRVGGAAKSEP